MSELKTLEIQTHQNTEVHRDYDDVLCVALYWVDLEIIISNDSPTPGTELLSKSTRGFFKLIFATLCASFVRC